MYYQYELLHYINCCYKNTIILQVSHIKTMVYDCGKSPPAVPLSHTRCAIEQRKIFARSKTAGARACEPQQYGQPEGGWNELTRLEYSPLLRVTTRAPGQCVDSSPRHRLNNLAHRIGWIAPPAAQAENGGGSKSATAIDDARRTF